MIGDFECSLTTLGPGCIATIRSKGAYEPARYLVAPGEAAGGLWKQIFPEKADLAYKIISQRVRNSLFKRTLSLKFKVVRESLR